MGKDKKANNSNNEENLQLTLAHNESADRLTFRFFCLINLFVVSYSIFVLFCVHVTVERNSGGQGVIHGKCQKRVQAQDLWVDMN